MGWRTGEQVECGLTLRCTGKPTAAFSGCGFPVNSNVRRHLNRRGVLGASAAALLLPACSLVRSQNNLFAQYLNAVVSEVPSPRTVVIDPTTLLLRDNLHEWSSAKQIQAVLPPVHESTALELLAVGNQVHTVHIPTHRLSSKLKVVHPTQEQLSKIFGGTSLARSWEHFYSEFPKSVGLFSFSNVGFNVGRTQAAFVVGSSCGGLCGSGYLVLMSRRTTDWQVQSQAHLWVS